MARIHIKSLSSNIQVFPHPSFSPAGLQMGNSQVMFYRGLVKFVAD
jgi:hypothetical protein